MGRPNIVYVFGDQWRAQATGYAGNPDVQTPRLDELAAQSIDFTLAVAGVPVCSPSRGCLLTGQTALTHGVFVNDVPIQPAGPSIADAFAAAGYATAYVGKWHVDGQGRSNYIPPERRLGFDHWQVLECTHDYNNSPYYEGESDEQLTWDGYDAATQTDSAISYIEKRDHERPFLLMLSWGPPHAPYHTAPDAYRDMYKAADVDLPPNVPPEVAEAARHDLAGYYAHCTVLDDCAGRLLDTLAEQGIADDTIFVFTSDHGDMIGSQGLWKKQNPWEESIRIPLLIRYPALLGREGKRVTDTTIDVMDMMPTLLGLADVPIPESVEGRDFSGYMRGESAPSDGSTVLACYHPFGQWRTDENSPGSHAYLSALGEGDAQDLARERLAGREYRGLRTTRYTYVRALDGPWLLYDNIADPHQLANLVGLPEHADTVTTLDADLDRHLAERGDEFLPGAASLAEWGYEVDEFGTVPYRN
jgi:arylsulfatase A-like enzyme